MTEIFDRQAARTTLLDDGDARDRAVERLLATYEAAQEAAERLAAALADHEDARAAVKRFGFTDATLKKAGIKPLSAATTAAARPAAKKTPPRRPTTTIEQPADTATTHNDGEHTDADGMRDVA